MKDIDEGCGIPLKEFDWGLPLHVAEPRSEYRVATAIELLPWVL